MSHTLLADDWPLVQRAAELHVDTVWRLWAGTEGGWFRPLPTVVLALLHAAFGLDAWPYHLFYWALYVAVGATVGAFAMWVTDRRVPGVLGAALFAVWAVHVEPVSWVAAGNELLATLCVLVSVACGVHFGCSGRRACGIAALLALFAALSAKETAVAAPALLCAALLVVGNRTAARQRSQGAWLALYWMVGALYFVARLSAPSPYDPQAGLLLAPFNIAYYVAVVFAHLPDNAGLPLRTGAWRGVGLPPTTLALLGLALVMSAARPGLALWAEGRRLVIFGGAWFALGVVPVVAIASGRTAFLPSVGAAWVVVGLISAGWRGSRRRKLQTVVGTSLWVGASVAVLVSGLSRWQAASREVGGAMAAVAALPRDASICLLGVPDHVRGAYAFRNATNALPNLVWPGREVIVVTDVEAAGGAVCPPERRIFALTGP